MAITKAEFKQAFREVVSLEFSHIPTDENSIQYTFSKKFNRRMEKLIKAQKKVYWNLVSTTSKRVAIIFLAIFTMFTAAFSVKAIREPIIEFIKQVYESFTHYTFDGDTIEFIEKEFSIHQIPYGYEQIDKTTTDNSVVTIYKNELDYTIYFSQSTTDSHTGFFVDNENGDLNTETINGINVDFKEWYDTKTAMWTQNGYVFTLDCTGNISFEEIKQMIMSIE
ncbi:MAG: DUF4367 domain-containing protein [Acutalibacteraceae bacterium]|nr:DUF4367 domain-containing protein [Acutalibacteraceae bacterium]